MRLRITTKLLIVAAGLLTLPWLGLRYLGEMREFVLRGQQQAQVLAARALAAAARGRDGLLRPPPPTALYVHPLPGHLEVDGYAPDWDALVEQADTFGSGDGAFDLLLGERPAGLYLMVRVRDDRLRYQRPGVGEAGAGDRVDVTLLTRDGGRPTYRAAPQGPGRLALETDARERRPAAAAWQADGAGYRLELGPLPTDLLGLAVRVEDRDGGAAASAVTGTRLRPLVRRDPWLDELLSGLGDTVSAGWLADAQGRVLAAHLADDADAPLPSRLDGNLVTAALAGNATARRQPSELAHAGLIQVAEPILADGRVLGLVLLEQDGARVLALQFEAFRAVLGASAAVLGLILLGLLGFAGRLTWRIRRLGRETAAAIDGDGRIHRSALHYGVRAGDELGDLARQVAGMLGRLHRYTGFLERMPRTLRHEINNPLNVIATSLHNFTQQQPGFAGDTYLTSAERAVRRLAHIVRGMTEAASLEDDLRREHHAPLDLAALAAGYAAGSAALHARRRIRYAGPQSGLWVRGNDLRLEQVLDKLLENALDFTPPDGEILLRTADQGAWRLLAMANAGPPIDPRLADTLFDSMTSLRPAGVDGRPHLGMGLYVVRLIVEFHGGRLNAGTGPDGDGAEIAIRLPALPGPRTERL